MPRYARVTTLDFTLTYTTDDDGVHLVCPVCHDTEVHVEQNLTLGDALLKAAAHMDRHVMERDG